MKQVLLLGSLMMAGIWGTAFAASDSTEIAKLRAFLIQESAEPGVKNYQQLGVADMNNIEWGRIGVTVSNNGVQKIEWANKKIAGSLDISNFSSLEEVYCNGNELTALDVNGCNKLKHLDCYENNLNTVDVTTNMVLDYLCVRYNNLRNLDLSNNTKLKFLCCSSNQLDSLDLSGLNNLTEAYCVNNQLAYLNVTGCTNLHKFDCMNNHLTTVDFSTLSTESDTKIKIKILSCANNKLTNISLPNCKSLTNFDCSNNELDSLDFSELTKIEYIQCSNNRLTYLAIDTCTMLSELYCNNNQLDRLNLPESQYLTNIECKNNNLDFYSLPRILQHEEAKYVYHPQNSRTIETAIDSIDLSYFYEIDGVESVYTWYDNIRTVKPEIKDNGLFAFEDSYLNKTLICRIINNLFPNLIIRYDVTLTRMDNSANEIYASSTVYAGKGCIHVATDKTSDVAIYSLQGMRIMSQQIGEGHTTIPLQRGAYIVTLNKKENYKLIVN